MAGYLLVFFKESHVGLSSGSLLMNAHLSSIFPLGLQMLSYFPEHQNLQSMQRESRSTEFFIIWSHVKGNVYLMPKKSSLFTPVVPPEAQLFAA